MSNRILKPDYYIEKKTDIINTNDADVFIAYRDPAISLTYKFGYKDIIFQDCLMMIDDDTNDCTNYWNYFT